MHVLGFSTDKSENRNPDSQMIVNCFKTLVSEGGELVAYVFIWADKLDVGSPQLISFKEMVLNSGCSILVNKLGKLILKIFSN